MTAAPDHVAIRFVGKDHQLGSAHHLGDRGQVVARRHAARRVVRRVEQDRPRSWVGGEEMLDVLGRGPKLVFDLQAAPARPAHRGARGWAHRSETEG